MTTIIVAALSVLVLVVLALIFGGKIRIFGSETMSCTNKAGMCEAGCEVNEAPLKYTDCDTRKDGKTVCCVDTFDSEGDDDR